MISSTTTRNTVASRCRITNIPALRRLPQAPFSADGSPGGPPATAGLRWAVSLTSATSLPCARAARRRRRPAYISRPVSDADALNPMARSDPGPSGAGRGDGVLDRAAPRPEGGLRGEGQAGVGVRRLHQATGQVEQVQVQRGQEALQVGVLVDGEVELAGLDRGQRARGEVEPTGRDSEADGLELRAEQLGRPRVHGAGGYQTRLVAEQIRLLRRAFLGRRGPGRYRLHRVASGGEDRGSTVEAWL